VGVAGAPEGAREFELSATLSAAPYGAFRLQACCAGIVFASAHYIQGTGPTFGQVGVVEEIGKFQLGGWALDMSRPDRPVTLDVRLGALWIGALQTLIPRPDIQARYDVSQPCGFKYTKPAPLRGANVGDIRFFIANTDVELGRRL
jgi:hypothetical protein